MESLICTEFKNDLDHCGIVEYEDFREFCKELKREQDEHDNYKKQRFVFLDRLLLDKEMDFFIQNVFDSNEDDEYLNSLVEEILSYKILFMSAVFDKQGSNCIAKVIKKLKNTDLAFSVTETLAPWATQIMTLPIARIVIQSCLNHLKPHHNKVLYEHVICHFFELATNEVGCISLKECIDTITGVQRETLLRNIADRSPELSNDSYGNYVVQHVLELRNYLVNTVILLKLKGHFVPLSLEKEGSHVIEKCLECCDSTSIAIVKEILVWPDGAYTLARHPFGNYVMQKALTKTKEMGYINLFQNLIKALKPRRHELDDTMGGRHVMNLLNSGI